MIANKFKISAPGSLILYGEHVIMYEKHVVIASLDLRTTIEFSELSRSENIIKIEFPDVDLSLNLSLEQVLNFFFANTNFNPMTDHILLLQHVQYFITSNGMWTTYEQKFSLQTFLFLLLYIVYKEKIDIKSFHARLTTELPIKAGLGSSTSFAACIAACFLHWARLQRRVNHNIFNEEELVDISEYVEYCEEVVQKYMFEICHEVCIYGQIMRFRYGIQEGSDIRLLKVPRLRILLIDSRIRRNKHQLMEIMAMIYTTDESVRDTFDKIDRISKKASCKLNRVYNIQQSNNLQEIRNIYVSLNAFSLMNQKYISEDLGMSYPNLERICEIANVYGLAGKLTGFGGYAYILLPPDTTREYVASISQHLMAEGFPVITTSVSCSGVRIDS